MENSKKRILCVFHSPCLDGFASAWVVGHRFGFDNVEFVGVKYGDPVPDMTDREVYIVDFSYPPSVLIPAAKTAKKILVLDHHKTARQQWTPVTVSEEMRKELGLGATTPMYRMKGWGDEDGPEYSHDAVQVAESMPENLRVSFGDNLAGAGTAWNEFFLEQDFPIVLNAIDCGDRWKFGEFERTRDVCEYCRSKGFLRASPANFTKFTELVNLTSEAETMFQNYLEVADRGADIAEANDNLILEFVPFDNPRMVRFMGHDVPCHAVPDFFKSSVGDRFGKRFPFSITYDDNLVPGHRKFSLRSDQETGIDVEVLAKQMKGGGHPHAAGFIIPFSQATVDSSILSMLTNRWAELNIPKSDPI